MSRIKTAEDIALDTARFLASGGKVSVVDHTANRSYRDPVTRSRKSQVEWARRHCKSLSTRQE